MIVVRHLDDNKNECDQIVFCNESCYKLGKEKFSQHRLYYNGKSYLYYDDNYNLYSDDVIDDDKFDGIYPCIQDAFLSFEYPEYCFECEVLLNEWVAETV